VDEVVLGWMKLVLSRASALGLLASDRVWPNCCFIHIESETVHVAN